MFSWHGPPGFNVTDNTILPEKRVHAYSFAKLLLLFIVFSSYDPCFLSHAKFEMLAQLIQQNQQNPDEEVTNILNMIVPLMQAVNGMMQQQDPANR